MYVGDDFAKTDSLDSYEWPVVALFSRHLQELFRQMPVIVAIRLRRNLDLCLWRL